jgi:hypothetical protein
MHQNAEIEIRCWKKEGPRWRKIPVTDRLARDPNETRRPECHGRVRVHKAGPNGDPPAHFEHTQNHPGCTHSYTFAGTVSPHPDPLE